MQPVRRRSIFKGKKVELVLDEMKLPDGRAVERELVLHPGAAVILALVRPGVILLVRQYRYAVGGVLYELPAGTLDPDETPEQCAARELAEETGFRPGLLRKLASFWSSPGVLTETMHLFLASRLRKTARNLDEDERIEVEEVALPDALDRIRDGRIADAKTIVGILYFARFEADVP